MRRRKDSSTSAANPGQLEHPNIARLIDGGTTKDKVSFLVMGTFAGEPITEYCKDKCKTREPTSQRISRSLRMQLSTLIRI